MDLKKLLHSLLQVLYYKNVCKKILLLRRYNFNLFFVEKASIISENNNSSQSTQSPPVSVQHSAASTDLAMLTGRKRTTSAKKTHKSSKSFKKPRQTLKPSTSPVNNNNSRCFVCFYQVPVFSPAAFFYINILLLKQHFFGGSLL